MTTTDDFDEIFSEEELNRIDPDLDRLVSQELPDLSFNLDGLDLPELKVDLSDLELNTNLDDLERWSLETERELSELFKKFKS